eukprot:2296434-Prymnesium_polylepis.1
MPAINCIGTIDGNNLKIVLIAVKTNNISDESSRRYVCVLRVDGTWHADGARLSGTRETADTRRGHARSSTHKSGV